MKLLLYHLIDCKHGLEPFICPKDSYIPSLQCVLILYAASINTNINVAIWLITSTVEVSKCSLKIAHWNASLTDCVDWTTDFVVAFVCGLAGVASGRRLISIWIYIQLIGTRSWFHFDAFSTVFVICLPSYHHFWWLYSTKWIRRALTSG